MESMTTTQHVSIQQGRAHVPPLPGQKEIVFRVARVEEKHSNADDFPKRVRIGFGNEIGTVPQTFSHEGLNANRSGGSGSSTLTTSSVS